MGYLLDPSLPVRQLASSRENNTLARHILSHFFLRRCARQVDQMEAALSSWVRDSDMVNLLSKLRSCFLFGSRCGRAAVPRCWFEGS